MRITKMRSSEVVLGILGTTAFLQWKFDVGILLDPNSGPKVDPSSRKKRIVDIQVLERTPSRLGFQGSPD